MGPGRNMASGSSEWRELGTGANVPLQFDHARLKKPKETDTMLMLKKDTEHHDLLGFQLNTYSMDLSEYTFSED
jgi:hypothetical protein